MTIRTSDATITVDEISTADMTQIESIRKAGTGTWGMSDLNCEAFMEVKDGKFEFWVHLSGHPLTISGPL